MERCTLQPLFLRLYFLNFSLPFFFCDAPTWWQGIRIIQHKEKSGFYLLQIPLVFVESSSFIAFRFVKKFLASKEEKYLPLFFSFQKGGFELILAFLAIYESFTNFYYQYLKFILTIFFEFYYLLFLLILFLLCQFKVRI